MDVASLYLLVVGRAPTKCGGTDFLLDRVNAGFSEAFFGPLLNVCLMFHLILVAARDSACASVAFKQILEDALLFHPPDKLRSWSKTM